MATTRDIILLLYLLCVTSCTSIIESQQYKKLVFEHEARLNRIEDLKRGAIENSKIDENRVANENMNLSSKITQSVAYQKKLESQLQATKNKYSGLLTKNEKFLTETEKYKKSYSSILNPSDYVKMALKKMSADGWEIVVLGDVVSRDTGDFVYLQGGHYSGWYNLNYSGSYSGSATFFDGQSIIGMDGSENIIYLCNDCE